MLVFIIFVAAVLLALSIVFPIFRFGLAALFMYGLYEVTGPGPFFFVFAVLVIGTGLLILVAAQPWKPRRPMDAQEYEKAKELLKRHGRWKGP
jgi:hypothetical protein